MSNVNSAEPCKECGKPATICVAIREYYEYYCSDCHKKLVKKGKWK